MRKHRIHRNTAGPLLGLRRLGFLPGALLIALCCCFIFSAPVRAQGLSATASAGDIPCEGGNSSVVIVATGGQPPYLYSINGGQSYQANSGFSLTAGSYTQLQVSDATGAVFVLSTLLIDDGPPGPPTTYFPDVDADGFGSGNPQQYCYDPGAGFALVNSDCNDGNAFVNPLELESCNGIDDNCNGSIDEGLSFENYYTDTDGDGFGTGTALYLCSDPGILYATNNADCNDASAAVNPSATETCNGIDDNCNGLIDSYDPLLSPAGPLTLSATVSPILCYGGTASISLTATGGLTPYDTSSTVLTGLTPGTYVYVITDANGCQVQQQVVITQPSPLVVTCVATPILCYGDSTTAVVTAVGGVAPYSGTGSFAISAGHFQAVVTDANGCTALPTVHCVQPAEITSSFSHTSCNSYTWNGTTYTQSGTYVQVLPAANGCDSTVTLTLTITAAQFPILLSGAVTPAACPGDANGAVDLTVSGGVTPYAVAWSTGSTQQDINGLSTGTYQVVVSDAVGCQTAASYTVPEPTSLPALGSIQGTTISCVSQATGTTVFSVSPVSDGINTTTYVWTVPTGFSIVSGQGTASITVGWTASSVDPSIAGLIQVIASTPCASVAQQTSVSYALVKPVTPGSISGNARVCPGETVTYSVAAVARATEYAWVLPAGMSFVGPETGNVIQVLVSAAFLGGDVKVCAGNACGFSGLRIRTTSLNTPLTPGVISGAVAGLCNLSGVNYSITAVAGSTSYEWTAPAGASIASGQGTTQVTVNYGTGGTGQLKVKSVNACGVSAERTLSVTGLPGRPDPITASPSLIPCAGSTVTYSVPTVTGASSYSWANSSGGSIQSGQGTKNASIAWAPTSVGVLQFVTVRSVNACGQSATRSAQFTPSSCVRRLADMESVIDVFPNPGSVQFTVRVQAEAGPFILRALDLSGRVLESLNGEAASGLNTFDWPQTAIGWQAGVYFVEWMQGDQVVRTRLIVE